MNISNTPTETDLDVTAEPDSAVPVFFVQESDEFIAEDIIGCLETVSPCRVVRVRLESEIVSALADLDVISVAILELPYAEASASAAVDTLLTRGARIILTAGAADEGQVRAVGWGMLARPFTNVMICAELAGQSVEGASAQVSPPVSEEETPA